VRRSGACATITRSHASLATEENESSVEDNTDLVHRYVELINAADVNASNSAGADACPERRVAPRLDADQDTKDEHQSHERWQERRRRECQEQDADRDEPRHAERGVHALLEEKVPGEVECEPPYSAAA
jgi:hypothetical protein